MHPTFCRVSPISHLSFLISHLSDLGRARRIVEAVIAALEKAQNIGADDVIRHGAKGMMKKARI